MTPSFTSSKLAHITANNQGRDFAVGDIHGCFSALQIALNAIRFNPAKDRLFSVGDLVDRGPESAHVLQWLEQPWFYAVCGNHDFMTWRSALGEPYPLVDHLAHGGRWLQTLDANQRQLIGQKLRDLPIAMEVQTHAGPIGLIHADCPFDDWQDMRDHALSPNAIDCCLWSTQRFRYQYKAPIRNIRAVIHGHITQPKMQTLGNVHYIDTGGWRDGHFTLLDLQRLQVTNSTL